LFDSAVWGATGTVILRVNPRYCMVTVITIWTRVLSLPRNQSQNSPSHHHPVRILHPPSRQRTSLIPSIQNSQSAPPLHSVTVRTFPVFAVIFTSAPLPCQAPYHIQQSVHSLPYATQYWPRFAATVTSLFLSICGALNVVAKASFARPPKAAT